MNQHQPVVPYYMTPAEVVASVQHGNRVAARINAGKSIKADSAVRHAMMFGDHESAASLAMKIMCVDYEAASKYVANLAKTKNIDIVSPHTR